MLKKLCVALLIACSLFSYPTMLRAENPEQISSGVYLSLPSDQYVEADEIVTYIFQLDNYNQTAFRCQIRAVSAQGWPLLGDTEQLTLPPGSTEYVVISAIVPSTVIGGSEDLLTLQLTTDDTERTYTVKSIVKQIQRLHLETPQNVRAYPGEQLSIAVPIMNNGTIIEQFSLDVQTETGWTVYWGNSDFNRLFPGQNGELIIFCSVPDSVLTGSVEQLLLTLQTDSAVTIEQRIRIRVDESPAPDRDHELVIPLQSDFQFSYLPPHPDFRYPWQLSWRARGDLFTQMRLDFYLNSRYDLTLPSTMFLGLTQEDWTLRIGTLGHHWDGLIAPPTYSSLLYYQQQTKHPWRLWVGPLTSSSLTPLWWGGRLDLSPYHLKLNYLHNLEEESYFQHALSGTYEPLSSLRDWKLALKGAAGFGGPAIPVQGGLTLTRIGSDWELLGEVKSGKDFYNFADFTEFSLAGTSNYEVDSYLTTGFNLRTERQLGKTTQPTYKIWSSLSINEKDLGITHTTRQDGSITQIDTRAFFRRQPNHFSLSASLRNEQLTTASNSLLLSGKYHHRFSNANYLEGMIRQSFIFQEQELRLVPGVGVRWGFTPPEKHWSSYGLIQWNLYPQQQEEETVRLANFQALFRYQAANNTAWQIITELYHQGQDPVYRVFLNLQQQDLLRLPSPWSAVHGKAFVDLNRNGQWDPAEPGIEGLPVFFNGKKAAVTQAGGDWEIPLASQGQHLVSFPQEHDGYYTLLPEHRLTTEINRSIRVLTPYLPPTEIKGVCFLDHNRNGEFDRGEPVLSGLHLFVYDQSQTLIEEMKVQKDGAFFLSLAPGTYQIAMAEDSFSPEYEEPVPVKLNVDQESPLLVFFPVRPREKEIEFFNELLDPELFEGALENQ